LKKFLIVIILAVLTFPGLFAIAEDGLDTAAIEWEAKYGDQRLWDYQVNAAFADQESWMYAWNPSMRPVLPDDDAIPAEEAVELAYQLIPQYGSELTATKLEDLTCIVSSYRKPEDDTGTFWSTDGTWVIDFWNTSGKEPQNICTIYINAHTGVPSALLLSSGTQYIGTPDDAKLNTGAEG